VKYPVYSVSRLTAEIDARLKGFGRLVLVGEISGWREYPSGHAYFTLKDSGAQISCVMFAADLSRCRVKTGDVLKDGAKVELFGSLGVYPARGNYQFVARSARLVGVGDLMQRYLELKAKLESEGLFDAARKRALPFMPRRIGIVTSEAGAVIHDMCRVLTRRFPYLAVTLYPCLVQGDAAPETIMAGIEYFNANRPDLVIVARGGGSFEDLFCFNDESLVRAVAACRVPVISAVGHETDFTLCDFAADVRAGTPSIAAEIAVPVKAELLQQVRDLSDRLRRAPERAGEVFAQRIDHLAVRLSASLGNAASAAEARLLRSAQRLLPALKDAVVESERRLSRLDQRLLPVLKDSFSKNERRIVAASAKLDLLDPANPLKRGYSLSLDAKGAIVRSVSSVKPGDKLTTRLADGEIVSTVH
jgi:exodeoxyribonuclease VII large subunit